SSASLRRRASTLFPYTTLFRSQVALLPGATPLAEVSIASATVRAVPEQETEPAIEVTPAEVAIGDTITTDGTGFDPDSDVTVTRSEEHTSELQSRENLVCRLLL